jgi:hypothetical protein
MSVLRKPDYSLRAFTDRASWLPIVNDFFMWMWPIVVVGAVAILDIISRWRQAKPSERLLVLWVLVGLLELVVHDSGNERRYVMFIPAFIALASMVLGRTFATAATETPPLSRVRWLSIPIVFGLAYLVVGSGLRIFFLYQIHGGHLHIVVALSAAVAVMLGYFVVRRWTDVVDPRRFARTGVTVAALAVVLAGDAWHFFRWAEGRREANYNASRQLGQLVPPGTPIQGMLANGLSLENQIHPIFIGHGFGNYVDRLQRDDVRYILTYVSPRVGYESQADSNMIQELLNHYPHRRSIAAFVVNGTGPADRAELFDKAPGSDPRARD